MTRKIHNILLLVTGLVSIAIGLIYSVAATPSHNPQTLISILTGLLCLQAIQQQRRKGYLASSIQAVLLILGAIGASITTSGLPAGQNMLFQSGSVMLSALGVCIGLLRTSISGTRLLTTASPSGDRQQGTVKWFNNSKGFGFISRTDQSDVFVHFRALRDPLIRSLNEGERVEFIATPNDKGVQAEDVVLLDRRTQ